MDCIARLVKVRTELLRGDAEVHFWGAQAASSCQPVVRGSLPRTAWLTQISRQIGIRQAAKCYRLAACAPRNFRGEFDNE
jgi:hypothetical protein